MCCLLIVKVEQVEFLWQQMRSGGVTPDVGTWVLRIQALTTVGSIGVRTHNLLAEAANDQLELHPHLLRSFCSPIFFVLFQNSSFSAEVSFYEDKMCLIFTRNYSFESPWWCCVGSLSIASMNCELDVNLIFELLLVALFLGHLSSEDVDHSSFG